MTPTICPSCHYSRTHADASVHAGICPQCGIVYRKWQSPKAPTNSTSDDSHKEDSEFVELIEVTPLRQRIISALLYTPEQIDSITFWGRCAALVLFGLWGLNFIFTGLSWQPIMNSFMHNVNLPFHEFGHVLFSPFGRFMMILGGSLFQILLPLGLLVAFVIKKDTFAASLMAWWCGQSFIDLSPYIADATYRGLPLIAGMGEEAHDWGNLLTMLDWLEYDRLIANISFTTGSIIIISSIIWGGYLLLKQKAQLID